MAIRDSGYKQAPSGNVAVDFVWGNFPPQTNDDRSGSSISYNATGGASGSAGSDILTATVTAASASAGVITYTSANEFQGNETVTITGLLGSVTLTGVSGSGTAVTYTTANTTGLSAGTVVTISGITTTTAYNGTYTIASVVANTSFTVAATTTGTGVVGSATCTYSSAFNLSSVQITSATSSQFTVTNAATDRAVSGAAGSVASVNLEVIPGLGADKAWSTTTDYTSNVLTETQPTNSVGLNSYTVPADNHVNVLNGYEAFPLNASNKTTGFNPAYTLQATVTAVSATGGTITYTANNNFQTGQTVTISGLYNYVAAGSTQPIATQYYAKTYTTASAFNLSAVTIASANATSFTVTNAATDSALTGVAGTAVVTVAASASTGPVPTVTGLTVVEADRQLGVANFNTGALTYTTSGATLANDHTVYSQSLTGTQTLGTAVNLVVYKLPTGENPGTQAGTYTY